MPHYEYECTACGHHFEVFQRMSDPKLATCPECGGPVERLIGPGAGIVFKGSGFYQTDYRSESYKQKAKSEGGAGASAKPEPKDKPGDLKPATPREKAGPGKSESSKPSPAAPPEKPPKTGPAPQAGT